MPLLGYTDGHSGYLLESGGQSLLVWGDIDHFPHIQITHPEGSIAFDQDSSPAAATRSRLLDLVSSEQFLIAGMHLGELDFARIKRRAGATAFFTRKKHEAALWLKAGGWCAVVSAFSYTVVGSACASTVVKLAQQAFSLRPAHSRCHQFVTRITEGFSPFVASMTAPNCFRLERSPGGTYTRGKAPTFSRRAPESVVRQGFDPRRSRF